MSLIRFEQVTKSFGGDPILEGVNLRIEEGEKIGLIGRNGTGKTTLFRLITGELEPDAGVIERMRRARVAYLAQMPAIAPSSTIFDVVMDLFKDLIAQEHELNQLEERMAQGDESIHEKYGHLQEEFAARGGYTFRTEAKRVLHGLGFRVEDFDLRFQVLSGGQRTRLMLALVLLQDADLLLLDEPENHLDIEAQEWLEAFMLASPKAIVSISHDRRMLSTVVTRILEVERSQLTAYSGNYDFFLKQKALVREQQQKAFDLQREFIEKEERWIERFRYKNTKASQVQSRIKRLEKLERLEAPLPEGSAARFHFGEVVRSGQWVIDAKDLSMAYGDLTLYRGLTIQVTRAERIGIIGPNGSGKTTLLRHLAGKLDGGKGSVTVGHKVTVGFYEQQHESLLEGANRSNDILTEIRQLRPDMTPEQVRTFMGRFLFTGDDVFKTVGTLSGGELSRVAVAKLILRGTNLLLLDEPTNHLDIASRETIETALSEFPGTILLVSHDRQFIDRLVNRLIVIENGVAGVHQGNYSHYHWRHEQDLKEKESKPDPSLDQALMIRRNQRARTKAEERDARKKRKQTEELEETIASMEAMIEELEGQFPTIDPSDYQRARTLKEEYDGLKADLQALYEEWEQLISE